jgi:hypothetical protein
MYLIRDVLNCKPGNVGELRKMVKGLDSVMERMDFKRFPLMTDVCGASFRPLVAEIEPRVLNDFTAMKTRVMSDAEAQQTTSRYHDLLVSGRREIYSIVP